MDGEILVEKAEYIDEQIFMIDDFVQANNHRLLASFEGWKENTKHFRSMIYRFTYLFLIIRCYRIAKFCFLLYY